MTVLVARARVSTRAPERLIALFREHMAEHGLRVSGPAANAVVSFPGGTALLDLPGEGIALRIEALTPDGLAEAKTVVAGHLDSFSPQEALGIVWTGDGAMPAGARPHNFRALRVAGWRISRRGCAACGCRARISGASMPSRCTPRS